MSAVDGDATSDVETIFQDAGLKVSPRSRYKNGDKVSCTWFVTGAPTGHQTAVAKILESAGVEKLTY